MNYRAIELINATEKNFEKELPYFKIVMLNSGDLPTNDLLIDVKYTAFNHHDALAATGGLKPPFAFAPGTDFAGIVLKSNVADFREGDEVMVTGSMSHEPTNIGMSSCVSISASEVFHLPVGMSLKSSMILGSAGVAVGMSASALINSGVLGENKTVAVTEGAFDIGAVAVALLSGLGYNVVAYTDDNLDNSKYAMQLGAKSVLNINKLVVDDAPLGDPLYDGLIDVAGGDIASALLKNMKQNATAVMAGNIHSSDLNMSMYPLIYRALNITGVNPLTCSHKMKQSIWQKLSTDWRFSQIDWLCTEVSMNELAEYTGRMLNRQIKGRVVVNHSL